MTPDEVVSAFCQCWSRLDADEMAGYFATDAIYQNMPLPPLTGKDAIREALAGMCAAMAELSIVVHKQISGGAVVMNQRTDVIHAFGNSCEVPIVGVFEIANGKIQDWREYYDGATVISAFPQFQP